MTTESLFDLSGKRALVTGGAMGIGRACVLALAKAGADVAIIDLNESMANTAVEQVKALGRRAFFVRCDVSDQVQVQTMMTAVIERFGRLDIAVNNAGMVGAEGPDETQSKENWDKVIGVNLTGVWLCAQAQAQQMIKQQPGEGKIINTASIAAITTCGDGAYGAAKAGVVHLTKTLADRWGRFNINVNCICPGATMSPLTSAMPEEHREQFRKLTPLGHLQRPEDVGGPIVFLASNASNFVTGQNLVLDGGLTLNSLSSLDPQTRELPPRISPEEEALSAKAELDEMNVAHDAQGVRL